MTFLSMTRGWFLQRIAKTWSVSEAVLPVVAALIAASIAVVAWANGAAGVALPIVICMILMTIGLISRFRGRGMHKLARSYAEGQIRTRVFLWNLEARARGMFLFRMAMICLVPAVLAGGIGVSLPGQIAVAPLLAMLLTPVFLRIAGVLVGSGKSGWMFNALVRDEFLLESISLASPSERFQVGWTAGGRIDFLRRTAALNPHVPDKVREIVLAQYSPAAVFVAVQLEKKSVWTEACLMLAGWRVAVSACGLAAAMALAIVLTLHRDFFAVAAFNNWEYPFAERKSENPLQKSENPDPSSDQGASAQSGGASQAGQGDDQGRAGTLDSQGGTGGDESNSGPKVDSPSSGASELGDGREGPDGLGAEGQSGRGGGQDASSGLAQGHSDDEVGTENAPKGPGDGGATEEGSSRTEQGETEGSGRDEGSDNEGDPQGSDGGDGPQEESPATAEGASGQETPDSTDLEDSAEDNAVQNDAQDGDAPGAQTDNPPQGNENPQGSSTEEGEISEGGDGDAQNATLEQVDEMPEDAEITQTDLPLDGVTGDVPVSSPSSAEAEVAPDESMELRQGAQAPETGTTLELTVGGASALFAEEGEMPEAVEVRLLPENEPSPTTQQPTGQARQILPAWIGELVKSQD